MNRRTACRTACLVASLWSVGQASHPRSVGVDFEPNRVYVRTYDRFKEKPAEITGNPGELKSLTQTDWGFGYSYTYVTDRSPCGCDVVLTITTFAVKAHQHTTVFMPRDGTPAMKAHEQGHYDLNVYAYAQAEDKALAYANRMLHRQFSGHCVSDATAALDAAFRQEFNDPYAAWRDRLHQAYNDLDQNGHDPKITADAAVQRVIAQLG